MVLDALTQEILNCTSYGKIQMIVESGFVI